MRHLHPPLAALRVPPPPPRDPHAVPRRRGRVQRRPDVEDGELVVVGVDVAAVVVVDDVADVGAAAVDDPVVPVEGQLVAQQRPEPRPRRELRRLPAKVLQRRVSALLRSVYFT